MCSHDFHAQSVRRLLYRAHYKLYCAAHMCVFSSFLIVMGLIRIEQKKPHRKTKGTSPARV